MVRGRGSRRRVWWCEKHIILMKDKVINHERERKRGNYENRVALLYIFVPETHPPKLGPERGGLFRVAINVCVKKDGTADTDVANKDRSEETWGEPWPVMLFFPPKNNCHQRCSAF